MAVRIGELVRKDLSGLTKWFTWESEDYRGITFEVEIAPISKAEFKRIVDKYTKEVFNRAIRAHVERVDNEAAGNETVLKAVKSWRGLTIQKLRALTLLNSQPEESEEEVEIDFSAENLKEMLEALPEFGGWVIQTATKLKNFDEDDELKN